MVAYERRVRGRTLTFAADDDRHLRAGGSRWRLLSGVDGPFEGETLTRVTDVPSLFWETWQDFNSNTTVYGNYSFTRDYNCSNVPAESKPTRTDANRHSPSTHRYDSS